MNLLELLFSGEKNEGFKANFGLLLLRIFVGMTMAFSHGLGKFPPSEGFISKIGSMGLPMPFILGWSASLSEFLGGIFLALGLMTRLSSFFIMCTMLVAVFMVHANDPFKVKELALFYLFTSVLFLFIGSGKFGLDSIIRRGK